MCCSPNLYNCAETISSCRFGCRAKLVKNQAKVNQERSLSEYRLLYKEALKRTEQQEIIIRNLERELFEATGNMYNYSASSASIPIPANAPTSTPIAKTSSIGVDPPSPQYDFDVPPSPTASSVVHDHTDEAGAGASTILELQERISSLEALLREAQDKNESLRDVLGDKESELEILEQDLVEKKAHIEVLEGRVSAQETALREQKEEMRLLQHRSEKVMLELQEQQLKNEQLQAEKERIEGEKSRKTEALGTWNDQWKPRPFIDEDLPVEAQLASVVNQYESLFEELCSRVEALIQSQEAYSDLEDEVRAHRQMLEGGEIGEDSKKALAKRAFAERQAASLLAENERLKKIEQCQNKLLTSWHQHLEKMETEVESNIRINNLREQHFETVIATLKSERERYRSYALKYIAGSAVMSKDKRTSQRPIHGGDGRNKTSRTVPLPTMPEAAVNTKVLKSSRDRQASSDEISSELLRVLGVKVVDKP